MQVVNQQVDSIVQVERQSPILYGNEQEKRRKRVSVNAKHFLFFLR